MELLTNSRLRTVRRCARLHYYRYIVGIRPIESAEELRFGTLVHLGLEVWWKNLEGNPLVAALAAVADRAADPYEQARVEVMLHGYDARWRDADLEPIAVEIEFVADLINPETGAASRTYKLAGKLDVLARERSTGRVVIVEHKTSSEDVRQGSPYWQRLRMDGQVSQYFTGARALGYEPAACVYDVLSKPQQRPSAVPLVDADGVKIVNDASGNRVRTKDGKKWRETGDAAQGFVLQTRPETPDEYRARLVEALASDPDAFFARGEVVRLEADELEHAADTWQTAIAMRDAAAAGDRLVQLGREPMRAHPRNPDGCERYRRMCSFFAVCTGADSINNAARFERVENVHAELAVVAAAG